MSTACFDRHGSCASGPSASAGPLSKVLPLGALLFALALNGCGKSKSQGGTSAAGQAGVVSNQLAAITAAGEPVTLDGLNRMYEEPPSAENAAPLYQQAFAALNGEDAKSPTFLAHNQKAVALLLQAAQRKACRYPVALADGFNAQLPHLAKIRASAMLLQQEAVSQAALGRTDAATAAILAGLRLARSLDNEPMLISKLVQVASLARAFDGLEQALTRKAFTDAQLLSLQTALDDAEPGVSFRLAMVGERANLVAFFQTPDERLAEVIAAVGGGPGGTTDLKNHLKMGYLQKDFAFALTFMSNLIAAAAMPYPQALDARLDDKLPDPQTIAQEKLLVSGFLLPASSRALNKRADSVARIRIARTLLAVERYRLKHDGAVPAALTDLSTELPDGALQDPFDGQPLRYKKLPGRGYAVYSIGQDRKDDGADARMPTGRVPTDVVMTIAR